MDNNNNNYDDYKDIIEYNLSLQTYLDKLLIGEATKAPDKKEFKEDIITKGVEKVSKILSSDESKVVDYYDAVRVTQAMAKLKHCIDNMYTDKRELLLKVF